VREALALRISCQHDLEVRLEFVRLAFIFSYNAAHPGTNYCTSPKQVRSEQSESQH